MSHQPLFKVKNTCITRLGPRVIIAVDFFNEEDAEQFVHNSASQVLDAGRFDFSIPQAQFSNCTCHAGIHPWNCNKPGTCARRQACR